jgi:adenylate cyclase
VTVPDDVATDALRRREALARVSSLLLGLGCTDAEIDQAVADDVVDLLVVDRMLVPAGHRLTQSEVAETTDIPVDVARRFWRALGFLDVGDDDAVFTEMDIDAVRLFQSMVAMDLVDVETAVQMARVIGTSMARIAEAETPPGSTPILISSGDSIIDADAFARRAGTSIPAMARLLEYVWRRHLQAATRRAMLDRVRGSDEGISPNLAVGFADMVGFTVLSQHLGDAELAAVVSRFEELAHDTVVALGGRVVKMIGDEVMFVVQTATGAAEIGLSLAEAYADDELLSDVRVGLAVGPVLVQDGDFYGPVVNLASRLVGVANPGTVLVSGAFRTALEAEGAQEFDAGALRPRSLKDIGLVQMWKLSRAGSEPDADRRRSMRWERLGEFLRDLEELRDRGEQVVRGTLPPVGSDSVETDGGDPLGPEVELPLEGGDRSSP